MFKTYAKHSTEKSRTIAISVNGKVRFITPETKAEICRVVRSVLRSAAGDKVRNPGSLTRS